MSKPRKIRIHGGHKVPIDEQAFTRLIRYYYSNDRNIIIHFKEVGCWGTHHYVARSKTHHITISPKWCRHNKITESRDFKSLDITGAMKKMNDHDTKCRVIHTMLHELKHAMQCDRNPIRYAKCSDDVHPAMKNGNLAYELSPLESEAEGWALMHFNKALEHYESWSNE